MSDLDRFKQAQDASYSGVAAAMAELRAGRKTGHWIWYIFPQLAGLGTSSAAQTYGIADPSEAADYLRDPVLRGRLLAAAGEVVARLEAGVPLARLMGSRIDVLKLISSMTLFGRVAATLQDDEPDDDYARLSAAAAAILDAAEASGDPPCRYTLQSLER